MKLYRPEDIPKKYVVIDVETEGLKPEVHQLTAVGIGSPREGVDVEHVESAEEETRLIRWIEETLSSYDTPSVVGWNTKFDFRFVMTRAMSYGVPSPLSGYEMVDDMVWFKKFTNIDEYSLDHVADFLDLGPKIALGEDMPKLYHEGKYKKIVEHCRRDVALTMDIHERILEAVDKESPESREDTHTVDAIPEVKA